MEVGKIVVAVKLLGIFNPDPPLTLRRVGKTGAG